MIAIAPTATHTLPAPSSRGNLLTFMFTQASATLPERLCPLLPLTLPSSTSPNPARPSDALLDSLPLGLPWCFWLSHPLWSHDLALIAHLKLFSNWQVMCLAPPHPRPLPSHASLENRAHVMFTIVCPSLVLRTLLAHRAY